MQNKLIDLNNHLYAQMERLVDESVGPEKLKGEIDRSRAVTDVAKRIIETGRLVLDSLKESAKYTGALKDVPTMLKSESATGNGYGKKK